MKPQIFLSYSNRDRALAASLERELKKLGVSAVTPETLVKPGSNWSKAVLDGIRKSNLVAVFLTEPSSASSSWIGYEVGSARALEKNIVIMKSPSFSSQDIPSDLAGWRLVDFDPAVPSLTAKTLVSNLGVAA